MVKQMQSNKTFLVVDFEFTTHDRSYGKPRAFFHEIIEVGAVTVARPALTIEEPYQSFVKPQFFPRLTEVCKNLTMITQKDVETGISYQAMLERLAERYIAGETYLAAWGDSDWEVISYACQRYKLPCPFVFGDYVDLSEEYKAFGGSERRKSLKHAMEEMQIDGEGLAHCALDDAKNAAQVMVKMLQAGWLPKQESHDETSVTV